MKLPSKEIEKKQKQLSECPSKKVLTDIIAENLSNLRAKENFTQQNLAEILDIEPNTVSRHERGILMPTIEHLMKYAIIYNTTLDYLLKKN